MSKSLELMTEDELLEHELASIARLRDILGQAQETECVLRDIHAERITRAQNRHRDRNKQN